MTSESTQPVRVFAIVPAAGRSRRMGSAKQLLDVGGRTMLAAVLEPLAAAGVAGVVLMTHAELAGQLDLARLPDVHIARNDDAQSEMIDSIRIGLHAWRQRETIADSDGFLVCPADHPGITTADFDRCIAAFRTVPDKVIVATRAGRRGHPMIFPNALVPFVESPACDQGLNALPRQHADRVQSVACKSPGISRDVDTPTDYQALE